MSETKKCPFCGEEININAIKCKHCHEWLNNGNNEDEEKSDNEDFKNNLKTIGSLLGAILTLISGIMMYLESKNPGSVNDFLNNKFEFNNKSLSNSQNDNENNSKENATNKISKSDYIGEWSNGRAGLSLEDIGNNKIRMYAFWSSSSVARGEWEYNCEYIDSKKYLICKDGVQTDEFVICNGKRYDDYASDLGECEIDYPETIRGGSKQVYSNANGKIIIEKKNPSSCNPFNHWFEDNLILKFYNDSFNDDSLQSTCFAKDGYFEYLEKVKYIDDYQDEYFKIIKDDDISKFQTIEKHSKKIDLIFNEFKNKYNKKMEDSEVLNYFAKLEKIDKQYAKSDLKSTISTAKAYNKAIDDLLNEIYQKIRKNSTKEDFEYLKQSEVDYIKNTENFIKEYKQTPKYDENIAEYYLCNMRRFRALLLLYFLD